MPPRTRSNRPPTGRTPPRGVPTRTPPRGVETGGFQSWAPGAEERESDRTERESAARRVEITTGRATMSHEVGAATDVSEEARRVFASSLRALGLNAYASVLAKLRR